MKSTKVYRTQCSLHSGSNEGSSWSNRRGNNTVSAGWTVSAPHLFPNSSCKPQVMAHKGMNCNLYTSASILVFHGIGIHSISCQKILDFIPQRLIGTLPSAGYAYHPPWRASGLKFVTAICEKSIVQFTISLMNLVNDIVIWLGFYHLVP